MGIRFFCPNGHKLHVKAFLAGKRGYCPKCGTKLLIPEASATALAKGRSKQAGSDAAASHPQSANLLPRRMESRPTSLDSPLDREAQPAEEERRFASESVARNGASSVTPVEDAVLDNLGGGEAEAIQELKAEDASAPSLVGHEAEAIWYVRPPSGGQYGPATRYEIDRWAAEGRIPNESLVWREGWDDWRAAGDALFGTAAAAERHEGDGWPVASEISTEGGGTSYVRQKKKKQTTLVVLLSVACFVLLIVFLFVVKPWST